MKKSILMLSVIFLVNMQSKAQQESQFAANTLSTPKTISFSMSAYNGPDKDAAFYLHKSKNSRIVGWATLGGGIVLSGVGLLLASGDYATNDNGSSTAGVLTVAGAVSGIVSIPFMIMASAYKQKAKLLINSQKTALGVPSKVSEYITCITFQIPIGK